MEQTPNPVAKISRSFYILLSLFMIFLPWSKIGTGGEAIPVSLFSLARESVAMRAFGPETLPFVIICALLIVTAIVGIVLSVRGSKIGVILYFAVALLAYIGLTVILKKTFGEQLEELGYNLFTIVGIGAKLCLILAALGLVPAPKNYGDLEFLRLSKGDKFLHKAESFISAIPLKLWAGVLAIGRFFKNLCIGIGREFKDLVMTFVRGDWKTKTSYFVMGFGSIARGQVLRGLMFLLFELVFIFYMIFAGGYWLGMLPSLGKVGPRTEYNELLDTHYPVYGDNSFKILLYGVLTLFFIIAFIYTWRANIKQNKIAEGILRTGKPLKSGKDDLRSLVDDNFHKTLLALPLTGILVFTVMPIVFMILVAFTNYDGNHNGFSNALFTWVGLENFRTIFSWNVGGVNYAATFGEILTWTLLWAFFATFTNYFLGIFVAMMINRKGIHLKKMWRTILVLTIAIPQFISLLYVSKMFDKNGIVNGFLLDLGLINKAIDFWGSTANNGLLPRAMVVLINIWIGIPYLMLIATGILMNIPADLYESSRIDGASGWKQFTKITLPYMLFITGPYLLTSFTSNMNNFNVIFLLTGGRPTNPVASGAAGSVGFTDLLITWLFKMTTGSETKYYLASVVGILVFIVVAVITLVVYNLMPSVKNEEDFQ